MRGTTVADHLRLKSGVVHCCLRRPPSGRSSFSISAGTMLLIVFHIGRYDARMLDFAVSAEERGARIVLITDQWISPIERITVHTLPLRIEAPSSWDSNIVLLFVAEALIAATVNARWPETQARIRELENLADPRRRQR